MSEPSSVAPTPVSSRAYFRDHYRYFATLSAAVAQDIVILKGSQRDRAPVERILESVESILQRFVNVVGCREEISAASVGALAAQIARLATPAQGVPPDIARAWARALAKFSRDFAIDRDHGPGGFASSEAKAAFADFCFDTVSAVLKCLHAIFQFEPADPRKATVFFDHLSVRNAASDHARAVIDLSRQKLEGFCSPAKAWMLYDLARTERPETAVEVGIYGGRSLIPVAQALKDNNCGVVIGIEAWKATVDTRFIVNLPNEFWWQTVNFVNRKADLLRFVCDNRLVKFTRLMEASAESAHHCIPDSIDLLHIDGGHSEYAAAHDVVNYFSKLRPGGIVVLDDINWASTHPAIEIVMSTSELLRVVPLEDKPTIPACAAFRKI